MRIIERNGAALEWIGASASLLCAFDCLVLPAIILIVPAAAMGEAAHWILFTVAAALSLSLPISRSLHRSWAPTALAAFGLAGLGLGHETLLSPMSGLTLAGAHWLNRRLRGSCAACHGRK